MDNIAILTIAQGEATVTIDGVQQACAQAMPIPAGATVSTPPGAQARLTFLDGTEISLGDQSSMTVAHFSDGPGGGLPQELGLHLAQGTFRIHSGDISGSDGAQFTASTGSARILLDSHGADIVVRDGLTQVGSMAHAPHLMVVTSLGETLIEASGGMVDILADGRSSDVRPYTHFEAAYFKAAAPLADETTDHDDPSVNDDPASPDEDSHIALAPDDAPDSHGPDMLAQPTPHALLTLFSAYFGSGNVPQDLQAELMAHADLDNDPHSLLDTTLATNQLHAAQDDGDTNSATEALRYLFADKGEELANLVSHLIHADQDQSGQVADNGATDHGQAFDADGLNKAPMIVQNSLGDSESLDDISQDQADDSGGNHNAPVYMPKVNSPQFAYKQMTIHNDGLDAQHVLQGDAGADDLGGDTADSGLFPQDSNSPTSAYDNWSASAESSETTTSETTVAVPHYSWGWEWCTVSWGWFAFKVPVLVPKVEYSQQLDSTETTTTTSYDDGSTEVQTMVDSDADGHWDQSHSVLTYSDGAQRTVTLFDSDSDGTWDSYETSLVYNTGEVAFDYGGDYADASEDVLAHLAQAADDPSVA